MLRKINNAWRNRIKEKKINMNLGIFNRLKHPIQSLSEYDQFKVRIWQNLKVVEKLSPE
jgi:hypothetical protein